MRAIIPLLILILAPAAARADTPAVLTGLDVLVRDNFAPLAGCKIGLITNHTAIDARGRSMIELFKSAPNLQLVALFSPEHGLKGTLDEKVADSTDPLSGLRVHSLYGETRRPSPAQLADLDTLIFDIQDIGTRFYTYIATMGYAMEEAARHKLRFVVLDRPDPITGTRVCGPMPDREGELTSYHRIPLVHGLTVGELARLFNDQRKIGCDLHIVKMEGWRRSMWFDETGLSWINPSPNMRSLTQATLYPAIGLLEACNLSVGRGTDTPFERFGAPWIDERPLAARLNSLGLKGVRFVPFRFTPTSSKFKDAECRGVQVLLTDREAFDPLETGLSIARELKSLHADKFEFAKVNNLLFNRSLLDKVAAASDAKLEGASDARVGAATHAARFTPLWQADLEAFRASRAKFLLYD